MSIPFTRLITGLPASIPFVGPETLERKQGHVFKARIGANESSFGLSPLATKAMRDAIGGLNWYGDPENFDLRQALSKKHDVDMDEICVDAGIDSLLGVIVRMLIEPDQPVVSSEGAYPTFNYHVTGYGGKLVTVPYKEDHEDTDALIAATKEHSAGLVYLSNPDNPMGTWHEAETIQRFLTAVPDGSVAALDEAYIEFASDDLSPAIDTSNERVIRLRTFSKAYGMAGARVGYAIAHRDLIAGMNKIRNHFGVNRLAQIGALASLGDEAFLPWVQDEAIKGRERIYEIAASHNIAAIPSATNFVTVDLGSNERAVATLNALLAKNIFIRMPGVPPLNRCIRIGIGTEQEHNAFANVFETALAKSAG